MHTSTTRSRQPAGRARLLLCRAVALLLVLGAAVQLNAAEARRGLVVCIGSDALETLVEDWGNDGTTIHCLEASVSRVRGVRQRIRAAGWYGKVSVQQFGGERLPYVADLVSQIVVSPRSQVPESELFRVLAPLGSLHIGERTLIKPWPDGIDEWTHYLHGPDNNAVANDTRVAPPTGMQWTGAPLWDRDHGTLPGFWSMVSAHGRVFVIEDRAPIAFPNMPGKFALVARDAFNGIELWRHPFPDWENITHHMKGAPPQLNRRMVAAGDIVYVTPGIAAPVVALAAADRRVLRRYKGTEKTQEIIHHDGTLYLALGAPSKNYGYTSEEEQFPSRMVFGKEHYGPRGEFLTTEELAAQERDHAIAALDAAGGHRLWEVRGDEVRDYEGLSLAVAGGRLVYQAGETLYCRDRKTGAELWSVPVETSRAQRSLRSTGANATIVIWKDSVFRAESDGLKAYALADGRLLWKSKGRLGFGYMSSPDLFVANGAVWVQRKTTGLDSVTGEPAQQRGALRGGPMGHDRCHRNKATERFIIESKAGGSDFSFLGSDRSLSHPWVRNSCSMGGMPCNGLLYSTGHACGCLSETLLNGVWALTGQRETMLAAGSLRTPLIKGPAYDNVDADSDLAAPWPTYRRDNARSGATPTGVPRQLQPLWEVQLPSASTQAIAADGKLFVSAIDAHTVCAIGPGDGKVLWTHTVGGRVDTPPTYHNGRLLFGSRDGWVHCLRARDGELAWRLRAAPLDTHLACAYGQVESLWPVHGSILMLRNVAYVLAGRSTFLDGGMVLSALDPATGEKLHERVLLGPFEEGREPLVFSGKRTAIQGNKSEVLVSDGELIYLSHWAFTADLEQVTDLTRHADHLITGSSMLDDTKHHRGFWTLSRIVASSRRLRKSASPDGDLIVMDGKDVFGIRFSPTGMSSQSFDPRVNGLSLFSMTADGVIPAARPKVARAPTDAASGKPRKPIYTPISKLEYNENWRTGIHINADALLADDDSLFLAGRPNLFPDEDIFRAIEGRMGGLLVVASRRDGSVLATHDLPAAPTWDGMSAANGKLFISLKNGMLLCYGRR